MCSVFFISHDDRFMIKTMHKEEIKLLLRCAFAKRVRERASCLPIEPASCLPACRSCSSNRHWQGTAHRDGKAAALPGSPLPLRSMLPKYYRHVQANPGTLLTRFYGVHRVKPSHGRKVRPGWLLCHSAHACLVCTFGRSAHFRTCI